MSENKAQAFLRDSLVIGPKDRLERVENALVLGMPDVNACIEGWEFWVENKQPTEPKRADTVLFRSQHPFSQAQMNWALSQSNAGGNCFAFIWTDKRGILISAQVIQVANEMTTGELIEASLWHGVKPVHKLHRAGLREAVLRYCMTGRQ